MACSMPCVHSSTSLQWHSFLFFFFFFFFLRRVGFRLPSQEGVGHGGRSFSFDKFEGERLPYIDIDFRQVSSSRPCLGKHVAGRLRCGPCSGGCLLISTGNSLFCVCVAHSRIWGNRVKWRGAAHLDLDLPPSTCRSRSRSQEAKNRQYEKKREKRHITKVGRVHDLSGRLSEGQEMKRTQDFVFFGSQRP
uniref:Putative secreted protein n=1 Tax=Ixodes ricinus TaxID=34613 RepID=A0A6B0V156_IXORI